MLDDDLLESLKPFNDLKRRSEITRDSRFQANLRLERRQRASNLTIATLSLFVIALSLIPNFKDLSDQQNQILLALTIINSVFIIITSLLEASGGFQLKGEALHRSARRVSTVFNKLMLLSADEQRDPKKIEELQREYQLALDDCAYNHENIDYFGAIVAKPSLAPYRKSILHKPFVSAIYYKAVEYKWLFFHFVMIAASVVVVWMFVFGNALTDGISMAPEAEETLGG